MARIIRQRYLIRLRRDGFLDLQLYWFPDRLGRDPRELALEKSKKFHLPLYQLSVGQPVENQTQDAVYLCLLETVTDDDMPPRKSMMHHGRDLGAKFRSVTHEQFDQDFAEADDGYNDYAQLKSMGF